jgi:hypothetical protein
MNSFASSITLKKVFRNSGLLGLAVAALAVVMPSQVFAQAAVCNADIAVQAFGDEPFFINELIPIVVTINALDVNDGEQPVPTPGTLLLSNLSYVTDCALDSVWPNCVSAGNDVVIATPDGSIGGTCGSTYITSSTDAGLTIDFAPTPDIGLGEFESCNVTFDVMVQAVAEGTASIQQVGGWLATDVSCVDPTGTPYPDDTNSGASGSVLFALSTERAGFYVTKDFTDDNPMPVDVHISCNNGIPLEQDFTITDPDTGGPFPGVGFVVKEYTPGGMDCHVWEEPAPGGYAGTYVAGDDGGSGIAGSISADATGCYFTEVETGSFTCAVTNTLAEASVKVNKVWDGEVLGNDILLEAEADWSCYNVRDSADGILKTISGSMEFTGAVDSDFITGIYPNYLGNSFCNVVEVRVPTAAEFDDSDCQNVPVTTPPSECTIYNTVFFEGIPTLSQYGLALMALLMLGVGMVGFRRFA